MQRVKLDHIDRRILCDLQNNGRMTNVELAQRVGISAPPCLRRVRALEKAGYIEGYQAKINGSRLDYKEMFFALVGLNSQAQSVLQGFESRMKAWPEIRECHMIRGGGDFLLKIVAKDKQQRDSITMEITKATHVSRVTTFETIRTAKELSGIPMDEVWR